MACKQHLPSAHGCSGLLLYATEDLNLSTVALEDVLKSTEWKRIMCLRYPHERAWWSLQRFFRASPATEEAQSSPSPVTTAPPPRPMEKVRPPAEKGEALNPGKIPTRPSGDEADKLHQYKKESSSQQAP